VLIEFRAVLVSTWTACAYNRFVVYQSHKGSGSFKTELGGVDLSLFTTG
jgi:hypothetical protein